jgi:hypothetical protein
LPVKKCAPYIVLPLLLAGAFNANALTTDDPVELPRVTITYVRPWSFDILYDMAYTTMASLFRSGDRAVRGLRVTEDYQQARQEVAAAVTDPLNSSDARCNVNASQATRQVTSRSDITDRYLAAFQLFTAIQSYKGIAGVRAAIAGSTPATYGGKVASTFTMTYMDGSSEKWAVAPGIAPALIDAGNIAPAPVGDGQIKPCPLYMKSVQ